MKDGDGPGLYKYEHPDYGVIYVGMSTKSVFKRLCDHSREPHFKPYLNDAQIYYSIIHNIVAVRGLEKLLIDKYRPILNKKDIIKDQQWPLEFEEPEWDLFIGGMKETIVDSEQGRRIAGLTHEIAELTHNTEILMEENKFLLGKVKRLEEDVDFYKKAFDEETKLHGESLRREAKWLEAQGRQIEILTKEQISKNSEDVAKATERLFKSSIEEIFNETDQSRKRSRSIRVQTAPRWRLHLLNS